MRPDQVNFSTPIDRHRTMRNSGPEMNRPLPQSLLPRRSRGKQTEQNRQTGCHGCQECRERLKCLGLNEKQNGPCGNEQCDQRHPQDRPEAAVSVAFPLANLLVGFGMQHKPSKALARYFVIWVGDDEAATDKAVHGRGFFRVEMVTPGKLV